MSEPRTQAKAEARRERNSEANHLGMDTAAAGMAAGGLGLALLHHQMSEAKALTMDERSSVDPVSEMAVRSIDAQPGRAGDQAALAHDNRSELKLPISNLDAGSHNNPHLNTGSSENSPGASEHYEHESVFESGTNAAMEPAGGSPSTIGTTSVDHSELGHSLTGGLQNFLSGASSAVTDISHGIEQRLDAITSATSEAIDSSLSAVSSQLSSLTSHIGDLFSGHGADLAQTTSATVAIASELVENVVPVAPAIVDPIFYQAFGPASDSHSLADGVVDTSGLASYGSTAVDAPITFLGQSYTDVADHTVHGLQGLTHGLV